MGKVMVSSQRLGISPKWDARYESWKGMDWICDPSNEKLDLSRLFAASLLQIAIWSISNTSCWKEAFVSWHAFYFFESRCKTWTHKSSQTTIYIKHIWVSQTSFILSFDSSTLNKLNTTDICWQDQSSNLHFIKNDLTKKTASKALYQHVTKIHPGWIHTTVVTKISNNISSSHLKNFLFGGFNPSEVKMGIFPK